jgi:hypothetical protein
MASRPGRPALECPGAQSIYARDTRAAKRMAANPLAAEDRSAYTELRRGRFQSELHPE